MARGLNRVMLIGNVGRDAELNFTPAGQQVAKFSIATARAWKDKQGELKEETQWHNIVAWGKLAEICGKFIKKGGQVFVEGRLSTRKYTGKDGHEKLAVEIVAEAMQLLGSRNGAGSAGGHGAGAATSTGAVAEEEYFGDAGKAEITDDDIPF